MIDAVTLSFFSSPQPASLQITEDNGQQDRKGKNKTGSALN